MANALATKHPLQFGILGGTRRQSCVQSVCHTEGIRAYCTECVTTILNVESGVESRLFFTVTHFHILVYEKTV